jgi:hypothetical protein
LKNISAEGVNSRTWKSALVFAGKEVWYKDVLTVQGMSHIVSAAPGCLFMQTSYVQMTFILSDPLTDLSRGWSSWLQCGGNMRIATPLSLHYSVACMDKCKTWLSSNRTIGLSFEGLSCAIKCFTHLTKWFSVIYPDGWTVC